MGHCRIKDPEGFLKRVDYLYSHIQERSEDEIELKDGRFLARYSSPITGPDGRHLGRIWCFRDVTDSKKAKAALARLATIVDVSADIIFSTDAEGNITSWNRGAQRVFGYTEEEILGKHVTLLAPAGDRDGVLKNIAKLARGERVEFKAKRRTKSGAEIDVWAVLSPIKNEEGRTVGISAIYRDITEHKRRDEAIKQYAAEIEDLYDHAPCGYHSLDADGVFLRVNDTELFWLGYSRDELIGKKNFRDLIPPEDLPAFAKGFDVLKTKGRIDDVEGRLLRKDGTILPVLINATAVRDSSGSFIATRTTLVDLTEQKRMQAEKSRVEAQFLQAQKMEAVGKLAGGVAHDFNNLLTAIKGFGEFLAVQLKDAPQPLADVQEILHAADRAAALTRQLLAFSRRQTLAPVLLDLSETISATGKLLRRLIGENIEIVTSFGSSPGRVMVDPGQMEQTIINLAVNARDAMPTGGKLTIATANLAPTERFLKEHPDLKPGPLVVLSVSDTGSGIAPDVLPRIFEPFFTTKEQGKGTGLGLSMVYGFVKQSGGDFRVTSALGAGTKFEIFLPQVAQPAPDEAAAAPAIRAAGHETVLLVEDDDTVRRLAARSLRAAGYEIVEAPSGAEALRLAQEPGRTIRLLLTDVVMPGMSGADLARSLVPRLPGLKVLYISGYTDDALGSHGVLESGVELLMKPFTHETLTARVRAVLDSP